MAAEVGVAYVNLVPSMRGFGAEAQRGLSGGLKAPAKEAGAGAGGTAARSFGSGLKSGLGKVRGQMAGAFKGAMGSGIGLVGGALAVGALKQQADLATAAASDLNETVNKTSAIFGKSTPKILAWGDGAAQSLGLSKQAALAARSSFGDMFLQIGLGTKTATAMSGEVIQLAADLGSFNNLETADVTDRISAAFRGEYDSLQAVIPNINAARVESEALAMTKKKEAKQLTAAEKAMAVMAIVQKDGARATGDFAKTSGDLANAQKIQAAETENLRAQLGAKLLPLQLKWTRAMTSAVKWGQENEGTMRSIAIVVGGVLVGAFAALAVAVIAATWPFLAIGAAIGLLAAGFVWLWKNNETFRNAMKATWTVLVAFGKAVVASLKDAWVELKMVWSVLVGWYNATANSLKGAWAELKALWSGIKSAFSAIVASLKDAWSEMKAIWAWITSGDTWASLAMYLAKPYIDAWNWIVAATKAGWSWLKAQGARAQAWTISAGKSLLKWMTWPYRMAWAGIKLVFGMLVKGLYAWLMFIVRTVTWVGKTILRGLTWPFKTAYGLIRGKVGDLLAFLGGLRSKVAARLSGIWDGLWSSFKSIINRVIGAWNGLSFTIGGQTVFGKKLPGATISTPNLPYLAAGGIATGPTLAMVGEGIEPEVIVPLSQLGAAAAAAGAAGSTTVVIDATGLDRGLKAWLRGAVRVEGGGSVQKAFGRSGATT